MFIYVFLRSIRWDLYSVFFFSWLGMDKLCEDDDQMTFKCLGTRSHAIISQVSRRIRAPHSFSRSAVVIDGTLAMMYAWNQG